MTAERTRRYAGRAAAFVVAALGSVAIAAAAPRPESPLEGVVTTEPTRTVLGAEQRASVQYRFEAGPSERSADSLRLRYQDEEVALGDSVVVDLGHVDSVWAIASGRAGDDFDVVIRLDAAGRDRIRAATTVRVGQRLGVTIDGSLVMVVRVGSPLGRTVPLRIGIRRDSALALVERIGGMLAGRSGDGAGRPFVMPDLPRLVGDSVMRQLGDTGSVAVAAANDLPVAFVADSATYARLTQGGRTAQLCLPMLRDPRDGMLLVLRSSRTSLNSDDVPLARGVAEYRVATPGRYGVGPGQALRVGCGSRPVTDLDMFGSPIPSAGVIDPSHFDDPAIRTLAIDVEAEADARIHGLKVSAGRVLVTFADARLNTFPKPEADAMAARIARRAWTSYARGAGVDTVQVRWETRLPPPNQNEVSTQTTWSFYRAQLEDGRAPRLVRAQPPAQRRPPEVVRRPTATATGTPPRVLFVGPGAAALDAEHPAYGCTANITAPSGVTLLVSRQDAARAVRIPIRVQGAGFSGVVAASMSNGQNGQQQCSAGGPDGVVLYGRQAFAPGNVLTMLKMGSSTTVTAMTADGTVLAGPLRVTAGAQDLAIAWDGRR